MTKIAHLPTRAVLSVSGADRVGFLNGLVSNDVAQAGPGRAVWAALLTAQGKWLADFFVLAGRDRLLLDVEAGQAEMLVARLSRYRMRADVAIAPTAGMGVFVAWDGTPDWPGAVVAPDPRHAAAGWRVLGQAPPVAERDEAAWHDAVWDRHRLLLGLPDGSRDMEAEKTVLLEAGFDELCGVSWTKGCYMGQELTARTRYRGLVKRRLLPVEGEAALPPPDTPILAGEREVGRMRSSRGEVGLALLRLEAVRDRRLTAAGTALTVRVPAWARLPETA